MVGRLSVHHAYVNRTLPQRLHHARLHTRAPAYPAAGARRDPDGEAYRAIEEAIVTLDVAPGEVVSEAQLATKLGFGRTPVREALQRLARERLVRILPRRGIVVAAVDVGEQLRLLEGGGRSSGWWPAPRRGGPMRHSGSGSARSPKA